MTLYTDERMVRIGEAALKLKPEDRIGHVRRAGARLLLRPVSQLEAVLALLAAGA